MLIVIPFAILVLFACVFFLKDVSDIRDKFNKYENLFFEINRAASNQMNYIQRVECEVEKIKDKEKLNELLDSWLFEKEELPVYSYGFVGVTNKTPPTWFKTKIKLNWVYVGEFYWEWNDWMLLDKMKELIKYNKKEEKVNNTNNEQS